ncbi:MAG: diguanylate cyclase/phosphodiesterase (GGDEF & EAL domains) with PAS/PAC sensor(s) [uncultured Paraburkholderia sp.]|nr:MAG: diguanylate cyclase/phosphodiesterase (GGDEF & EAL domains) with PAS/PAC sensor(s) [uncultured Paraburkholderia sp.]
MPSVAFDRYRAPVRSRASARCVAISLPQPSMKLALSFHIARRVGHLLRRHVLANARLSVSAVLALLGLAMFALAIAHTVVWRHELDAQRRHALNARKELDGLHGLQAIFLQANADFLQGFGSTRLASFAWPVSRVGAAVACFQRLEQSYAGDSGGTASIQSLRQETARWAWLLAEIAVNARSANGHMSVDSAQPSNYLQKATPQAQNDVIITARHLGRLPS